MPSWPLPVSRTTCLTIRCEWQSLLWRRLRPQTLSPLTWKTPVWVSSISASASTVAASLLLWLAPFAHGTACSEIRQGPPPYPCVWQRNEVETCSLRFPAGQHCQPHGEQQRSEQDHAVTCSSHCAWGAGAGSQLGVARGARYQGEGADGNIFPRRCSRGSGFNTCSAIAVG